MEGGRGVAAIVIVGKREDADFALQEVAAGFHPILQIASAVHEGFIPRFGQLFDGFAIAELADIGEICGDGVALGKPLGRARHPRMVNQGQRDVVLSQEIVERRAEPVLVADFEGEARLRG